MSKTSILNKARELGIELATSPEYLEMKNAEAKIIKDLEARMLVQNFQELKKACEKAQIQGFQITESQWQKLQEAEETMLLNPIVRSFTQAYNCFQEILKEVDQKIWEGINGCSCSKESCSS